MSNVTHCYKCGRFMPWKDADVSYDDYSGGYEEGYSECKKCKCIVEDK